MARFCFNANREDAMDFLKTFYERVDVEFELNQVSSSESCIILKDKRDKDIFMNLSERLSGVSGFSQPSYVPKWKAIRHRGPFFPQYEKEPYMEASLYDKTSARRRYKLSPTEEKAAFLYAALIMNKGNYIIDTQFKDNFWKDFKEYLRQDQPFISFDDIDWRDVVGKYKKRSKHATGSEKKYKHGFVEIDGNMCTATPFAVDDMSVFFGDSESDTRRGRIRRAITPADVTLNLSSSAKKELPNIAEFKEVVYKPGMKWAAKWNQPITGNIKYMDIFFNNPTEEEFVENFIEMYDSDVESGSGGDDSDDNESEEKDYGEDDDDDVDEVDEDDLFGDIGDISDDEDGGSDAPHLRMSEMERRRRVDAYAESIPREEQLDFGALDDQEMDLPLSYIVPPKTQWEYVLDACKSGFRVVGNLGKVSDAVMRLVADGAALAIRDGTANVLDINNAFVRYAEQRNV